MQDMKGWRTLLVAIGLLALLLAHRSWAEESDDGQTEAAVPTITGLRAAIHGDTIILSWTDDGPEAKAYAVYRSEKPFAGTSLAGIASVAVVAPGKQNYVDRPPQGSSFYYAVAAISSEGQVLFAFKANQNATVVAISAEAPQSPATPPQPAGVTAAAPLPASVPPSPPPLNGEPLIAKAAPAAEKQPSEPQVQPKAPSEAPQAAKPVIETPPPAEAAATPDLVSAVEPTVVATSRSTPLPAFLYRDSSILPVGGDATAPGSGQLPPETAKALQQLQDETESVPFTGPELRLLPRAQREGDSATILLAAESLLTEGDWRGARAILEPLSRSGNASPERDCAHFYIGITLAQEGKYRDALFEFLAVREAFPAQTKPWIDFVVEGLARP
mgnify:CR=1 FL=1